MKGQTKGASPDAFDAVRALKPYKGGNDTLWGLDQLNNIDKHRLLIAVGSVYRSFNVGAHIRSIMREAFSDMFGGHPFPKLDLYVRPADRLCPLKAGDELFIDAPDADPKRIWSSASL